MKEVMLINTSPSNGIPTRFKYQTISMWTVNLEKLTSESIEYCQLAKA